jgi:hypothetical protein
VPGSRGVTSERVRQTAKRRCAVKNAIRGAAYFWVVLSSNIPFTESLLDESSTSEAAEDASNSVLPVNLESAIGKPKSEMITASGSTSWSNVGAGGASPRNSHTVRIPIR